MPRISQRTDIQTVITTFELSPATCQDLINALNTAYAEFISKQPGFIAAGLHVNDAQTRIANYSQWESRAHFHAMLRSQEMQSRSQRFNALCKGFEPVMYDVISTFRS